MSGAALRRAALGPLYVVVAIVLIELTSRFVARIPNPPAVLVIVVVFAGFRGGLPSGLASSVVTWCYLTWAFSAHGRPFQYAPDDLKRVVVWAITFPALAIMVGKLNARAVAAERLASDEAKARFTKAFEASPVGILLSRLADGRIVDVNAAALDVLGFTRAEVEGKTTIELGFWMDPSARAAIAARLRDGETVRNVDVRARTRSGAEASLLCSMEPLCPDAKGDTHALTFLVDITERRRAEEALRRQEEQLHAIQKMEAVGRLAGGIAHDFNNLLTIIGGNADFLARAVTSEEPRQCAEEISEATARAATLTRQLLAFSRHEPLRPTTVDLNATITKLASFLARTIGESITLSTELAAAASSIRADPGQIDQAITNLVINARDAMPEGGTLTLETEELELDEAAALAAGGQARPGRFVVLTASDTGTGMDEATRARIFEPFFTTKGALRGTGLGLATVYGIVTGSQGFLSVTSDLGKGSVFRLYFPAVAAAAGAADAPSEPRALAHGNERILLVEDDAAVRALTARLLAELGYDVQAAEGPREAIAIAEREGAAFDLVLTDVVMPEMNGRALADRIAPLLPDAKVLFFSGYADDSVLLESIRDRSVAFLPKPFTRETLAAAIRAVLEGDKGPDRGAARQAW